MTPKAIESLMKPRCPNPGQVEALYEARNRFVKALQDKGAVTSFDLANLDRLGRAKVADVLWSICTHEAREALLTDPHHQVRSIASISNTVNHDTTH